jgi:hypothetical protein
MKLAFFNTYAEALKSNANKISKLPYLAFAFSTCIS